MKRARSAYRGAHYFVPALACLASTQTMAIAQQNNQPVGYEVTETNIAKPEIKAENIGPVRMARFSLVQGKINCRPSTKVDWSPAYLNQPIRQGEQILVPANSRAEISFDDGSVARLGGGAFVTMQTLYSDDKGEFTEIKLNDGIATFRLKNNLDVYQVDSPCCSIKATGPAEFRVGARNHCEVADHKGTVTVENHHGSLNLAPKQFVPVHTTEDDLHAEPLPPDDTWENWNDDRDRAYDEGSPVSRRYLPSNIALAAPDLDNYGSWHHVARYGDVWVPRVREAGWRPYHHGHWTWVDPFGWTWVGAEPWGWAPYHYGTWVHSDYGWAWDPGPAQQCWTPAACSFSSYNGNIAWAPLAPEEVVYPSRLAVGFSGGDWSVLFSIGGTAAYYPGRDHRCYERAWNNTYINRATYVTNYNGYGGRPFYASNNNSYLGPGSWTPRNARFGGGSIAPVNRFGGGGNYDFVSRSNITAFQRGRAVGVPRSGFAPAVGPSHVRPTLASLTPGRSFNRLAVPAAVASRPMFRSALDPRVAKGAPNFGSRIAARGVRQPNTVGRPGIGAANMAGKAGFANRPGAPFNRTAAGSGTSNIRSLNRPGSPLNRTPGVPNSVQAARKTLGMQKGGDLAGTVGRPNIRTNAVNPKGNPRITANRPANAANTFRRNTAAGQVQKARQVGAAGRPNAFQSAATQHTNNAIRHTTPTRTNTAFARPHTTGRVNNQAARINRQPSVQRNNSSFAHHNAAPPATQHRTFNAPRNNAPRGNFGGGFARQPQSAPRGNFGGGGGFARQPQGAPHGNFGGGAKQPQSAPRGNFGGGGGGRAPQAAPHGGPPAGGGGHPGGGGGHGGGRDKRG
ncbi:MAG: FecR family protein [Chthonomonadales bacterium]|nr:FecR family protein [Chthonomonadales bacterium]